MNVEELASIIGAVSVLIGAIAAVFWGRRVGAVKDEIIRAKDERIRMLEKEVESCRQRMPEKLQEYVISLKSLSEERIRSLENELRESQTSIARKNQRISELMTEGKARTEEIACLQAEISELRKTARVQRDEELGFIGYMRSLREVQKAVDNLPDLQAWGEFARDPETGEIHFIKKQPEQLQ
jgi:chromosome segregation ATPase